MREILFRAKRIDNGEWVEGNLIYSFDVNEEFRAIIVPVKDSGMYEWNRNPDLGLETWYKVDPKTICQYTGLSDKNGNRIWENDIVRCNRREKEAKYKLVWDKTYADFRIEKLNGLGIMPICIEEGNTPVFGRHYECIGNIFDNPELLKGE